jgi:peptidoglycan/LPS O-acetylase OafA/YrhL
VVVGKLGIYSAIAGVGAFGIILYELQGSHIFTNLPTFWARIGAFSYSLYLTHVIVAGRFIGLVEQKTTSLFWRMGAIFVAMGIALLLAYLFYICIERYFQRLSKKPQAIKK